MGEHQKPICKPLISVVTVVYNDKENLPRTLESVVYQSYPLIEIIVIDGGSTDGTLSILDNYRDKIDCIVSEPDTGIYDAMNKGFALASGDYVAFMNCGDSYASHDVVSQVVNAMNGADVVYGLAVIRESKKRDRYLDPEFPPKFHFNLPFCHQAAFVKRSIREHVFDVDYSVYSDLILFKSLYDQGKSFQKINVVVADYDPSGVSSKITAGILIERFRAGVLVHGYMRGVVLFTLFSLRRSVRVMLECFNK